MATTPTLHHPQFIWRFYSCQKRRYHIVIASTESDARSQLPDAPCLFVARFPSDCATISYWRVRP
ncbi:host cell division inhibitor Icd-like protein [Citrobacter braakii]|uniref:host cell division inhibitor Icd-like protein n=1 Tax=Citrobacter braakii TaxID=57706 RepID=UPI001FFE4C95|nr:host cell division inhibitor Icd-like protein [Citrobacter braakii]MCK2155654.1 host cell division inhibitor Icd-like protein [Citrobacter braakii]